MRLDPIGPEGHAPHALHAQGRHWPQTNCYVDLWIELLHAEGLDPLAGLGVLAEQDHEGDHFTFAKYPPEDLELLYGLAVRELAIYDRLETHLAAQWRRGRMTLVEVDGWHLPDTRGLTYRAMHGKTTIGVRHIDPAARRLEYYHNSGLHALEGEDYDGLFADRPDQPEPLPPYVEFACERAPPLAGAALFEASLGLLRRHLGRAPRANPVSAWRAGFAAEMAALFVRPPEFFHLYAFNLNRQLGLNWELFGDHLDWLRERGQGGLEGPAAHCRQMAEDAKTLQFRMARMAGRKRFDPCEELFARLEAGWEAVVPALAARL